MRKPVQIPPHQGFVAKKPTARRSRPKAAITKKGSSDNPKSMKELRRLRDALCSAEATFREAQREELAKACGVAIKLCTDVDDWRAFCAKKWWEGVGQPPTTGKQDEALRYVLRWVCGKGEAASKKASFYLRALAPLIDEGVGPADIAHEIKERGGLKALADGQSRKGGEGGKPSRGQAPDLVRAPRAMVRRFGDDEDDTVLSPVRARPQRHRDEEAHSGFATTMLAAFPMDGMSIFSLPVGARFVMEAVLREVGPPISIEVIRLEANG